jgi:hypothetical protein
MRGWETKKSKGDGMIDTYYCNKHDSLISSYNILSCRGINVLRFATMVPIQNQ